MLQGALPDEEVACCRKVALTPDTGRAPVSDAIACAISPAGSAELGLPRRASRVGYSNLISRPRARRAFVVFKLPPDRSVTEVTSRENDVPGLYLGIADKPEADCVDTFFRATPSINHIFVAEGEVLLDDGWRAVLTHDSCLVHLETRLAWHNVSAEPVVQFWFSVVADGGLTDMGQLYSTRLA